LENRGKAYVVVGPESSGSRFVHNLIQAAGCEGVKYNFTFPHDGRQNEIFKEEEEFSFDDAQYYDKVVMHRSVPDGFHQIGPDHPCDEMFPDLKNISLQFKKRYCSTVLVICVRDHYAMIKSQISRKMAVDAKDAMTRIQKAYQYIFDSTLDFNSFIVVSYDSLVSRKTAPKVLMDNLGLDFSPIKVIDGTAKWYDEDKCCNSCRNCSK
jgi:hypothetical protein